MRIRWALLVTLGMMGLGAANLAAQTSTRVMVRVTANDAKIIGSGVGGATVTIRDALTGEILAQGVQEGGTGDSGLIMGSRERGGTVFDSEGAAGFVAELEIDEPTWVEITGTGPLGTPDALRSSTRSTLLIPGRDVLGDGIVIELLGFTVELTQPAAGTPLAAQTSLDVGARVTMLCGCPTEPGGTWDSDDYDIVVRVLRDGEVEQEVPMRFAGETSMYAGTLAPIPSGWIEIEVLAMDAAKGNFGLARKLFAVGR